MAVLMGSAFLWCFAARRRAQAMAIVLVKLGTTRISLFFRVLMIVLLTMMLAACAGSGGMAPVDDRAAKSRSVNGTGAWHTVRKGDTLFSIAFAHNRDYREVARINQIRPPYTIYPGQRLKMLAFKSGKQSTSQSRKKQLGNQKAAKKTTKKTSKRTTSRSRIIWKWPAKGKLIRKYSARAPRKKGIGIGGKAGQGIYAAARGKVVYSGNGLIGYGNLIIVKHNESWLSAYAHNKHVFIKEGQVVKRGEKIATMGQNENNTPMLHFEIRKNGKSVNPVKYLPKK